MKYPNSLNSLIESFQKFPGVGPKTAERMALFAVLNLRREDVERLANELVDAKNYIKFCQKCGLLTDVEYCDVCLDLKRDNKILVVENTKDAIAIEKTLKYKGRYHILNGVISPLDGIGPQELNIDKLIERVITEAISEIIIATSATIEGETTALYISKLLENTSVLVTRIGYGLPAGGDIEYADEVTLMRSLEGRRKM